MSGEINGEIEYSGGLDNFAMENLIQHLKVNVSCKNISINGCSARNLKIESKNQNIAVDADEVQIPQTKISKLATRINQNEFTISCRLQNKHNLKANGIISKNLGKIEIKNGSISLGKNNIDFSNSTCDFYKNDFGLNISFLNHKEISSCKITTNTNRCYVNLLNVRLRDISEITGSSLKGIANGNIELKNINGIFQGQGNIKLKHVLSNNCETNIFVNFQPIEITANATLKKRGDAIKIDFTLPFSLSNSFNLRKTQSKLSAHIYGRNKLENFFELPDRSSLQGDFDCDYHISGTPEKPNISGYLSIQNLLISINSVLLSNGTLKIVGDGENLKVVSAKFIDRDKHTATATGYGKLFFDKFIPNLDVNLDLDFKKFFILDSDALKIQITGAGKMSGPLDNMKLSGDVKVPYAEIANFEAKDDVAQSKINFENDSVLQARNKETDKDSFFQYDILMHGQKIKVIGSMFELFLKGDLTLSMYEKRETLIGDLTLVDGKINLFGKRLKFVKGNISFIDKHPYNPKVNLLCRKNFGNLLVSLEIINSPKKGGSFKLYSNPSYNQDVILAQMLFNKDTKSLSAGEAAQLVNAISGLKSQGYLFSMINTFTNIGLLDNISFSSDDGKYSSTLNKDLQTSNQQVNISAGKYLQDNVYISLNKKNEKTTFDIDISLTPTTSVKANTAGEIGLNWKYRY